MMKKLFLLLATITLLLFTESYAQTNEQHPIDRFYSKCIDESEGVTVEILNCIDETAAKWDEQLNKVYTELRGKLSPASQKVLRDAQRQWITYRDLEFKFNDEIFGLMPDGTVYSIIFAEQRMQFIKKRVLELETYLQLLLEQE